MIMLSLLGKGAKGTWKYFQVPIFQYRKSDNTQKKEQVWEQTKENRPEPSHAVIALTSFSFKRNLNQFRISYGLPI